MTLKGVVKGTHFEVMLLKYLEDREDITVFPDIKLFSHKLVKETQIDCLVVTPWSLYALELKSFNSWLKGQLNDREWVGITGRKPTVIYNPVMQNYEHIRSLNAAIYRKYRGFVYPLNYVIVPDSCRIETECDNVINMSNFLDTLVIDSQFKDRNIDVKEMTKVINSIRMN